MIEPNNDLKYEAIQKHITNLPYRMIDISELFHDLKTLSPSGSVDNLGAYVTFSLVAH